MTMNTLRERFPEWSPIGVLLRPKPSFDPLLFLAFLATLPFLLMGITGGGNVLVVIPTAAVGASFCAGNWPLAAVTRVVGFFVALFIAFLSAASIGFLLLPAVALGLASAVFAILRLWRWDS